MFKKTVSIIVPLLVFTVVLTISAPTKRVLDESLDMKTLQKMASTGQLIHLQYDKSGKLTHRMVATLINAPLDTVWKTVTDFKNYNKFIPGLQPPKVRQISKTEYVVDNTLNVEIYGPIKNTNKYSVGYELKKPILYMYDPSKKKPAQSEMNIWKLVKVDGGKKTLIFYLDEAPDLKDLGSFVYGIVKDKPELSLALQVSPVSIMVQQLKNYVEKK